MTQVLTELELGPIEAEQEAVINGSGPQRMRSEAVLQRSGPLAGKLDVVTRTWTTILLHGFTGGVYIQLRNANRAVIGVTGLSTYGVDGRWVGSSDRTESWAEQFTPDVAAQTAELEIIQIHAPRDRTKEILAEIAEKARLARETAVELGLDVILGD